MKIIRHAQMGFDAFTSSYVRTILFVNNDESTPSGGEPLDKNYDASDIATETMAKIQADCAKFQATAANDIQAAGITSERAGFWFLTARTGHGTSFTDDDIGTNEVNERLNSLAKSFGHVDFYIGDDGKIYQTP